jgi:hypothetical protein
MRLADFGSISINAFNDRTVQYGTTSFCGHPADRIIQPLQVPHTTDFVLVDRQQGTDLACAPSLGM